jgi:hypothetical protein
MPPSTRSTARARDESQGAATTNESEDESESGHASDDESDSLTEYCVGGDFDNVKRMLEDGSAADEMALFHAVTKRHAKCTALLVRHSADVNAFPLDLSTLYWAVRHSHDSVACVDILLAHDADVEMTHPTIATTPLMEACIQGHENVARLLCSYGASRSAVNQHGNNAAWFARVNGHHSLSAFLQRSRLWTTPLHFLEDLTPQRAASLLQGRVRHVHARVADGAPSPLDLAKSLEQQGRAPPEVPAAMVLACWRDRLVALAMGIHARLGATSALRHLGAVRDGGGCAYLLEKVVDHLAACEVLHVAGDGWDGSVEEGDSAGMD